MYITEAVLKTLSEKELTPGKGKITLKNVQFGDIDDKGIKKAAKKYKVKISGLKAGGSNEGDEEGTVTGEKKDIVAYFLSAGYGYPDAGDINSDYPKLFK